jgi:hypothetical protein
MEFGRSFACPFQQPTWPLRVLVGASLEVVPMLAAVPLVVSIIHRRGGLLPTQLPLLGMVAAAAFATRWIVLGYLRRLAKETLAGEDRGLPAWDRFGDDLVEGLKLWLVALGLFLPAIGITACLALLFGALGCHTVAWLPVLILLPLAALATLFYLPAALLATVAEGEPWAAFDIGRVGSVIGRAFGPYVIAILVAFASEILAQLGFLILCAGIFATRFIAHCIAVHAFASAYREGAPPRTDAVSAT